MAKINVNYRKIWEDSFGKIPKDQNGISYEIHHIDGNRNNNSLDNLVCVSIEEHYKIHFDQKDYYACACITKRMKLSEQDRQILSERIAEANRNRPNPMKSESARRKLSEAIKGKYVGDKHHGFGKKRPEHSEYMKSIGFGKNKSKEHLENHRKSWLESTKDNPIRAKVWKLCKDNAIIEIKNLKRFCRENNLNYLSLYKGNVVSGYKLIGQN